MQILWIKTKYNAIFSYFKGKIYSFLFNIRNNEQTFVKEKVDFLEAGNEWDKVYFYVQWVQ